MKDNEFTLKIVFRQFTFKKPPEYFEATDVLNRKSI